MNKKTLLLLLSVLSTGSLHAQKTETNQLLQQESALTDSSPPPSMRTSSYSTARSKLRLW